MNLDRRGLIVGAGVTAAAAVFSPAFAASEPSAFERSLTGQRVQGGFIMGRTHPEASILVGDETVGRASRSGLFIVGFDRDAALSTTVGSVWSVDSTPGRPVQVGDDTVPILLAQGVFPSSRIDGLPPSTVEPADPELLARIQRELAAKTAAFASCADTEDFADGFVWPLESYRVSSAWGAQRILNGTPARPHYGIDLAAPQGTPIHAPAPGLVVFAEPDMHFEGGLVLIDHGQGLITGYLHQSRIDVAVGQRLVRGQQIGLVGMKGRATGPHLCWRMKWRDRNLDPSLMVGVAYPRLPSLTGAG